MVKILVLIPARSGSKGIPNKNVKDFCGKPLLAWSIEQATKSKYAKDMKIVLSTDSIEYASIGNEYGAEVPFIRPKILSQDKSIDIEFIKHAVDYLKEWENYDSDIILQLRPTQPCRKVEDIDKCIKLFLENRDEYDSLRTLVESPKSPYKIYQINDNVLEPIITLEGLEAINMCRQDLPVCYLHNGYIDILNTKILEKNTISGNKIYPYIMNNDETIDIDNIEDWEKAEKSFKKN
jgi:CMP-N,N'-diacetyllegionaminic acid synthase